LILSSLFPIAPHLLKLVKMSPEDVEKLRQSDMAGVVVGKGEEGEGEEKKRGW
jgi:hypothetical protein